MSSFKTILGLLNKMRSKASEEVFNNFVSISRRGSHINFHMEAGEGTPLVRPHGRDDLTYPAQTVNHLSMRLIQATFTPPAADAL